MWMHIHDNPFLELLHLYPFCFCGSCVIGWITIDARTAVGHLSNRFQEVNDSVEKHKAYAHKHLGRDMEFIHQSPHGGKVDCLGPALLPSRMKSPPNNHMGIWAFMAGQPLRPAMNIRGRDRKTECMFTTSHLHYFFCLSFVCCDVFFDNFGGEICKEINTCSTWADKISFKLFSMHVFPGITNI